MHPLLNDNLYLVKEHVRVFKASNNFDIYDPGNGKIIMYCKEDNLGLLTKIFRFTKYKRATPFHVEVTDTEGNKVLSVKRGISIILSTVEVFDENDLLVGKFKQKFFSIGGKFDVLDSNDKILCSLKGKWTSWDFRFVRENIEFAQVSKKWAGIGKELFTSADNYMLKIDEVVPKDNVMRTLIMAAVLTIDMVLKE